MAHNHSSHHLKSKSTTAFYLVTTQRHQGTAENGISKEFTGLKTYLQLLVAREEKE